MKTNFIKVRLFLRILIAFVLPSFVSCGGKINESSHEEVPRETTVSDSEFIYHLTRGDLDYVRNSLKKGYIPKVQKDSKLTALHIASARGYKNIVIELLNVIDVNAVTNIGQTPLHFAAISGESNAGIVNLLLEHKANPLLLDAEGKSASSYANQYNHKQRFMLLKEAEAREMNP